MSSRLRQGKHQVTVSRALSKLGIASRSQAAQLIALGKVTVNGKAVHSPNIWVDLKNEKITIDGNAPLRKAKVYLAFNKPAGVVTTRSDELGRQTVYQFFPENMPWLFPVGRLDKDTSGLLLLTNDTRFGDRVTDPRTRIAKKYEVHLNKDLLVSHKCMLELPMTLTEGTKLQPAHVTSRAGTKREYEVTIYEGKNRQIRRAFEHLGYEVVALRRVSIGSIEIGDLKEGEFRALTKSEVASFG
jgi:23S rRNA pseudouridine2605 synthase